MLTKVPYYHKVTRGSNCGEQLKVVLISNNVNQKFLTFVYKRDSISINAFYLTLSRGVTDHPIRGEGDAILHHLAFLDNNNYNQV